MVGRGDHLRVLHAALARAAEGDPAAVLVSGELGVGKTRLVREFLASIEAEVFAGACVPVVGEPLPYAALTQSLRGGSALVRQEVARSRSWLSCYPAAARGRVATRSPPAPSTGPRRDSGSSKRC